MSLPIAPRPMDGVTDSGHPPSSATLQKTRKISTACGACKQRKTRCSGGSPCEACAARNSACIYDATSDQRRKIANQKNVQSLQEAQHDLDRLRQLTGGMIAIIKAGDLESTNDLMRLVRGDIDLSSLAAFVRNEVRANLHMENAFQDIDFHINGPSDLPVSELPSPKALLHRLENRMSQNHMDGHLMDGIDGDRSYNTDPSLCR